VGGAIGLAIVSAVLGVAAHAQGPAQPGQLIPGMLDALHVVVAITAVGVVASAASVFALRRSHRRVARVARVEAECCA
jgi:hypothetical protein